MDYAGNVQRIRRRAESIQLIRSDRKEQSRRMMPGTQSVDIRRERMRWRDTFPENTTENWRKYTVDTSSSRMEPVIGKPEPAMPLVSGVGIRWKAGIAVFLCLIFMAVVILLVELMSVSGTSGRIHIAERKIEAAVQANEQISSRLLEEANDANVCIEAAGLNLIPSSVVKVVRLSVPPEVNMLVHTAKTGNAEIR